MRTNARVVDFDIHDHGVLVKLATGETIEAAALVGADGIRSQVRARIVSDGEPPSAGAYIYRALIPAAEMPKDEHKPYPTLWVGPGTHAIYYPVRDWAAFNFAATVVASDNTAKGEGEAEPDEALQAFRANHHAALLRIMTIPKRFNRYIIRHRQPIENWTMGRATLLGDAAHPIVQYVAQARPWRWKMRCAWPGARRVAGRIQRGVQRYQERRIVRARASRYLPGCSTLAPCAPHERLVRNAVFEGRSTEDCIIGSPGFTSGPTT